MNLRGNISALLTIYGPPVALHLVAMLTGWWPLYFLLLPSVLAAVWLRGRFEKPVPPVQRQGFHVEKP